MIKTKGFTFFRNAEGGSSAAAAPAGGAPSTVTTNAGQSNSAAATVSTSTVGDAAAASQAANSAAASVPAIGGQPQTATAAPDFKTSLGEYANDPALQDFKDPASLAKSYLEGKKLIGQKLGIPGADSTPEAKAAFYKALGVPDAPEGYAFAKPESLPEGVEYSEEHAAKWAKTFKDLNVPAETATALRNAFMQEVFDQVKDGTAGMKEDKNRTDANFDERATAVFGDKKVQALQNVRGLMEKHLSKETMNLLEADGNDKLVAYAEFVSNYSKEMTGEDSVLGNNETPGGTQSEGELRQEMRRLMALPEYSSPFAKGKEEHERVKAQATELSQKIAKAREFNNKRK